MAPLFGLIKDVDRNKKHALKMRVVRMFTRAGFENKEQTSSLEVVFHDKEGGRVTAVIKRNNIRLFEDRLLEGRVYGVNNYYVENNNGKFRTSLAKFKIVFHAKTMLVTVPEESVFPNYMFDFRDFATLVDVNKVDETLLFDIIGRVCEIHNPQDKEFSGRRSRLIEIILEDLSGRRISCTLWGAYVEQILSFESSLTAQPPVLILQMCRAKVYRDKVTLSNSFDVTQIHTLETIPEIVQFRSKILKTDVQASKSLSRGSLTLSRLEVDDLATGNVTFHPVEHLYMVDEASSFWVCAIIGSFIDDWWYLACTRCHRKLAERDEAFYCAICKKSFASGVYRYKLRLEVLDSTANASLLCWDREAEKLIGRSCHDLRVEFLENHKEFEDIPDGLAKLIDQTVLFKVVVNDGQIHNESSAFTVSRLVTDATLVEKYNKWTIEQENESDFLTLMLKEEADYGMDTDDEVSTPVKKVETVQIDKDSSTVKRLTFDGERVDSNSGKKSRVLSKNGKSVRKTVKNDEEMEDVAEDGSDDGSGEGSGNGRIIEDDDE